MAAACSFKNRRLGLHENAPGNSSHFYQNIALVFYPDCGASMDEIREDQTQKEKLTIIISQSRSSNVNTNF